MPTTPSDSQKTVESPAAQTPATAAAKTVPPVASHSSTAKGKPLYYFSGQVDVKASKVWMTYTSALDHETRGGLKPMDTIPEGPDPGEVVAHTVSVHYDTTNAFCGGTAVDPHLCGSVDIISHLAVALDDVTVTITAVSPSTVIDDGPYVYGSIKAGDTSAALPWTFDDSSGTDFAFVGVITGTPAAPSPCAVDCSLDSLMCDDSGDGNQGNCVQCVVDQDCPQDPTWVCINNNCIFVSGGGE